MSEYRVDSYRGFHIQHLGKGNGVQVLDPDGNHVSFSRDLKGDIDAAIDMWIAYRAPLPEEKNLPSWLQKYNARRRGIKKWSRT